MTKWFTVGKITKPHGLQGEVRVFSMTDFPEERFAIGNTLYLDRGNGTDYLPLEINTSRVHKKYQLIRFKGYNHINDVEKWKGLVLKVPEDQLSELSNDEFYYHEIIGCRVITEEDEELGEVKEIIGTGANDVWVVKATSGKEILIPYIPDVVKEVDLEERKIFIHVMEGLLE
ncbi:MAG TPA: ribosome maturation factor RimM [Bacillales bacterium]|nr:ribosome maturation factor RimM [Bacillales bacterium]